MVVYALINDTGRIYVGQTANLDNRLRDHNRGKVFSTKGYRPWQLLYREEVLDRVSARQREKYFKHGVGKEFLKRLTMPR